MTPREIASALNANPIDGLTHDYGAGGFDGWLDLRIIAPRCPLACASMCADSGDLGAVLVVTNAKIDSLRVTAETLRSDLVTILAWSLGRDDIDPAAPETRAALRTPGLYGEILRKHLEDRRTSLIACRERYPAFGDRYATLIAAIDAALETST